VPLPVLIVGDVHGDLERLFRALQPHPPAQWRTVFLGDMVDGGPFGVGGLRYARDRPNSTFLLGNHEVAMLWALRDSQRIGFWVGMGGQPHDLQELRGDPALQEWLRSRPALLRLEDGTLAQHSDNDNYSAFIDDEDADPVEEVNRMARLCLENEREDLLWEAMSPVGVFRRQPRRLADWLQRMGARRVVHGHWPHRAKEPDAYHGGSAVCYDGSFSRYYGARAVRGRKAAGASIGPLPPIGAAPGPGSSAGGT
jgi:diadenosine tetraphosphatase ApaH/serine/threonine PP2A family protein phosphatase